MIPHYVIYWAILLLICAYAFWRGQQEERVAAAACLLATIVTVWVIPPVALRYSTLDPGQLAIDAAMLATFMAIALRSKRFWPLWVAGLQLTMSTSHLMKAIDANLLPRVYAAAAVLWSYPILLIIFVGTWRAHRLHRVPKSRSLAA
jgi:hypothetical protein